MTMRPDSASYAHEPVRYPPLHIVDLADEAAAATGEYTNHVIQAVNGHCLRLAVFDGEYPWHRHTTSDELFLVVEGCLFIDLTDGRTLRLGPWQAATVPAGTVHRTRTEGRAVNLCFEELAADTEFLEGPELGGDVA